MVRAMVRVRVSFMVRVSQYFGFLVWIIGNIRGDSSNRQPPLDETRVG